MVEIIIHTFNTFFSIILHICASTEKQGRHKCKEMQILKVEAGSISKSLFECTLHIKIYGLKSVSSTFQIVQIIFNSLFDTVSLPLAQEATETLSQTGSKVLPVILMQMACNLQKCSGNTKRFRLNPPKSSHLEETRTCFIYILESSFSGSSKYGSCK